MGNKDKGMDISQHKESNQRVQGKNRTPYYDGYFQFAPSDPLAIFLHPAWCSEGTLAAAVLISGFQVSLASGNQQEIRRRRLWLG